MSIALALTLVLSAAPTDAELTELGKTLAQEFMSGSDPVTSRVDANAMLDRSLNGTKVPDDFRRGFTKGLLQGFKQSWGALAKELSQGGSVKWTRNLSIDGQRGVQLRILYKGGAFNFVEFLVSKDASNALRLVDFYDLANGSWRSEDVRMLAFPLLADLKLDTLDRMLGKEESQLIKHIDSLKKMNEASLKGDWAGVETIWASLPRDVQDHRLFIKPYISALSNGDEGKYQKAMARFLALYPDDAAAQVMGIDFYFLRKKWPECMKSIAAVEKRAGSDAWFSVLRGNAQVGNGKAAEAKKELELAMSAEPKLPDPYYTLIDMALGEKKWADVAKWMNQCEKNTGVTFDAHAQGFEGFLASKEGKAYDKAHPAK
ncbi:MAG: hypothetical protein U0228_06830 [Myxococcaceae bacterium]